MAGEALTAGEVAYLREEGLVEASDAEVAEALAAGAAAAAAVVREAWSVEVVAARAGVDGATVRRWAREGAVASAVEGRFPAAQFGEDGKPLPGLGEVLRVLPSGWSALSLDRWLRAPSRDLAVDGRRVSPRWWLSQGRPLEDVLSSARTVEVT